MAKKIPKVRSKGPVKFFSPGSGLSWEDKLYMLAGGLSPLGIGRRVDATKLGRAGRFGLGSLRFMGLTNPWFAIPGALTGLAKYAVGKAFDPYKDEEGKWTKEGLEQMSQARMEREERTRANAAARGELAWMDDPNFDFWGGGLKASKLADYPELAKKYDMNEGGIARLL